MIAFEMLKYKTFKYGQLILPMNKRSVVNHVHKAKLEPQMNAILRSVLNERENVDKNGIDRRVSIWTLMLRKVANSAKDDLM